MIKSLNKKSISEKIKKEVVLLYKKIKPLTPLSRGRLRLFGKIISLVKNSEDDIAKEFFKDTNIRRIAIDLNKMFADEQMCLEKYWASYIINNKYPTEAFRKFPYYSGYVKSSDFLYYSFKIFKTERIRKVLYVGSGPLPITPILLTQKYKLIVDSIERDNEAFILSRKLIKTIGLDNRLRVIHQDILNFKNFKDYDVVILAILVGNNETERMKIINFIYNNMVKGAFLIIKNVTGLRQILYSSLRIKKLKDLNLQGFTQNYNEIVNMVITLKKN